MLRLLELSLPLEGFPKISALIATISIARQRYAQALTTYSKLVTSKPGTLPETSLLNLSDVEGRKQNRNLNSSERILTRHSARLPSIILQQAVSLQINCWYSRKYLATQVAKCFAAES